MTTYRTGNPIGSSAVKDLYDNAENLDVFVNDRTKVSEPDRLGAPRKTWNGMETEFDSDQDQREVEFDAAQNYRENTFNAAQADKQARFNAFIAASGYDFIGEYAAGITFTEYNQIVRADGEFWRLSPSVELPYTTTGAGVPEGSSLLPLGEAVLRQQLADIDQGASLIGRGVVSVESLKDLIMLPSIAVRGDLTFLVKSFYPNGSSGGGQFTWEFSANKADSNGITVIDPIAASGWDGTAENLSELFDASGSGLGCFVKITDGSLSLSEMGALESNTNSSNSVALNQGLKTRTAQTFVVDGDYSFAPGICVLDRPGESIRIDQKQGSVTVNGGASTQLIDIANVSSIICSGVSFNPDNVFGVTDGGNIFGISSLDKIERIELAGCEFTQCRILTGGFDPLNIPAGCDEIIIRNNTLAESLGEDLLGRVVSLNNIPIKKLSFTGNNIGHFDGAILRVTARDLGYGYIGDVTISDNKVVWDKDFILTAGQGFHVANYLTLGLIEAADRATCKNNSLNGIKSRISGQYYDFYLGAREVTVKKNEMSNCFTTVVSGDKQLMKAKGGPLGQDRVVTYTDNTYVIDLDYLNDIGVNPSGVSHALLDLGEDGAEQRLTAIVDRNTFKLSELVSPSFRDYKNFYFNDNKVLFENAPQGACMTMRTIGTNVFSVTNNTFEKKGDPASYVAISTLEVDKRPSVVIVNNNDILNSSNVGAGIGFTGANYSEINQKTSGSRLPYGSLNGVFGDDHSVALRVVQKNLSETGRIILPGQEGFGVIDVNFLGKANPASGRVSALVASMSGPVGRSIRIRQIWDVVSARSGFDSTLGRLTFEYNVRSITVGSTLKTQVSFYDTSDVLRTFTVEDGDGLDTAIRVTASENFPLTNLRYALAEGVSPSFRFFSSSITNVFANYSIKSIAIPS